MEISALQQIVRDRYFKTDSERGIYHTALWFHEEVGELSSAIASGDQQNAKEEFADVLMWLLTLANLMQVDMEEVVTEYLANSRKLSSKWEKKILGSADEYIDVKSNLKNHARPTCWYKSCYDRENMKCEQQV